MSTQIEKVIQDYIVRKGHAPKGIFTAVSNNDAALKDYKITVDEHPLILVNKKKFLMNGKNNGLLITDRGIHFRVFPRAFFTSITMIWKKPIEGFSSFEQMRHFQIGEHDACFGTAYVGHNLEIDHMVKGLVRMGTGIEYSEEIIEYINGLAEYLVSKHILLDSPQEYAWQ